MVRTHLLSVKAKEICTSFVVALQTAKITAGVPRKCLVKMEKALNFITGMYEQEKA